MEKQEKPPTETPDTEFMWTRFEWPKEEDTVVGAVKKIIEKIDTIETNVMKASLKIKVLQFIIAIMGGVIAIFLLSGCSLTINVYDSEANTRAIKDSSSVIIKSRGGMYINGTIYEFPKQKIKTEL